MVALVVPPYVGGLMWYGAGGEALNVGYMPEQPVPYSHALHAGELGMDCRYCHASVEHAAHANIPPTKTCINCHAKIWGPDKQNAKLTPVHRSWAEGVPIEWIRIHDLPGYAYFNHSAHVNRGIGCVTCHGRIDRMEVVYQAEPLSMGWCIECHRNPERYLRPLDEITNMTYMPPDGDQLKLGRRLREQYNINPSTDCSTCHR